MPQLKHYKEGLKAYRNGFAIGAFSGIVICVIIGKAVFILPIFLGLVIGSIAFERKMKQDGKIK